MVNLQSFLGTVALFSLTNAAAVLRPRDCSFTWAAEKGDTCQTMASTWGISVDQFTRWNAGVICNALVVGKEYCLLWDGPEPVASTTTSTAVKSSTTTSTKSSTTTAPAGPSPTQDGIASDCQKYHFAVAGDTCGGIVTTYGTFSLAEFYKWNPAVGDQCTSLWLGYYYCVAVKGTSTVPASTTTTAAAPAGPTPTQEGISSDCKRYHLVKAGNSCQGIVDTYGTFTLSQFYSWNPAVGSTCSALWAEYYVCIGVTGTPTTTTKPSTPTSTTPSPTQPDVNPKCNNWYLVVSEDYCQKIADQYKISLASFYTWNPAIGDTCASLWLGYYVCVGSA